MYGSIYDRLKFNKLSDEHCGICEYLPC